MYYIWELKWFIRRMKFNLSRKNKLKINNKRLRKDQNLWQKLD